MQSKQMSERIMWGTSVRLFAHPELPFLDKYMVRQLASVNHEVIAAIFNIGQLLMVLMNHVEPNAGANDLAPHHFIRFIFRWNKIFNHLPPGCWSTFYTPRFNEVDRGVYWYHLVRLSVRLSVDRIVPALYLQQYSSNPFHICTSYQAT